MTGPPTTATAYDRVRDRLAEITGHAAREQHPGQAMARCPAHDDHQPSLSITRGHDRVLLNCHANCHIDTVIAALNMVKADLYDEPMQPRSQDDDWTPHGPATATYRYVDEQGQLLFGVCRTANKAFPQWHPDPTRKNGRAWNLNGTRRVLYRLPQVLDAANAGRTVYVVEGEKDVHSVERAGAVATCNPGGAGKWRDEYATSLRGCTKVIVVADLDTAEKHYAGQRHAAEVAASLTRAGIPCRIVQARTGKDATDHLAAGHSLNELVPAVSPPPDTTGTPTPDAPPDDEDTSDHDDVDEDAYLAEVAFRRAVADAKQRILVRDAAREEIQRDRSLATPWPEPIRLDQLLAEPDQPTAYLVDDLWPAGGRVVLAAQYKAGKTTLRDNLVRSLADGEKFLGRFEVRPLTGTIIVFDTELSRDTLRGWLRRHHIVNPERIHVIPMRGRTATFDLRDPTIRSRWVTVIRELGGQVIILDCLAPVLTALNLDPNREASAFLDMGFDPLLAESGAADAVVTHHMGHVAERSRGDSRIRDWPDVEWRLVREKEEEGAEPDPAAARFFTAYGRDVEQPEQMLSFDPVTKELIIAGGSRSTRVMEIVVEEVERRPGINRNDLCAVIRRQATQVDAARKAAAARGLIRIERGPRGSQTHFPSARPAEVIREELNGQGEQDGPLPTASRASGSSKRTFATASGATSQTDSSVDDQPGRSDTQEAPSNPDETALLPVLPTASEAVDFTASPPFREKQSTSGARPDHDRGKQSPPPPDPDPTEAPQPATGVTVARENTPDTNCPSCGWELDSAEHGENCWGIKEEPA